MLHSLFSRVSRRGASFLLAATEGYFSLCIVAPVEQISELLVRSRHNESEYSPELRGFEQSAIMIYEESAAFFSVNGEGGIDGGLDCGLITGPRPGLRHIIRASRTLL